MTHDVGYLLRVEHEIDRHEDGAGPGNGEPERGEGVRVSGEDRHAVSGAHALGGQPVRELVADGVEFGVGPGDIAAGDGRPVGQTGGRSSQQVAERLPVNEGVRHGTANRRLRA